MQSVLILTSGFGEGHNAAARNVHDAICEAHPGVPVRVWDLYAEAYPRLTSIARRNYLVVINRFPLLWKGVFALLHRSKLISPGIRNLHRGCRRLREVLEAEKPSAIVVTFPSYNYLLQRLVRDGVERSFKTVTVVTDSITVNAVWYGGLSDFYCVNNPQTAAVLRHAGVPLDKIKITGFPVSPVFARLSAPIAPPVQGQPWRVLYMINSCSQVASKICTGLLNVPGIQLTVTVGKDELLRQRVHRVAQEQGKQMAIFGWTPDMPELMRNHHLLIGKAGGASVQESLAAQLPMIITQVVPGQEEGNARLVIENNAGCYASNPHDIVSAVRQCFVDEGKLWRQWRDSAARLGSPRGAFEVVNLLNI